MANTRVLVQAGVGTTVWHVPDYRQAPFAVSLNCFVNGSATYSVQDTPDDPMTVTPTNINNHPTINAATTNQTGNYAFPVNGIRLNVTAGAGTVTLVIMQGET